MDTFVNKILLFIKIQKESTINVTINNHVKNWVKQRMQPRENNNRLSILENFKFISPRILLVTLSYIGKNFMGLNLFERAHFYFELRWNKSCNQNIFISYSIIWTFFFRVYLDLFIYKHLFMYNKLIVCNSFTMPIMYIYVLLHHFNSICMNVYYVCICMKQG